MKKGSVLQLSTLVLLLAGPAPLALMPSSAPAATAAGVRPPTSAPQPGAHDRETAHGPFSRHRRGDRHRFQADLERRLEADSEQRIFRRPEV